MQELDNLSYDQLKNIYWDKGGPRFNITDTSKESLEYGRNKMLRYLKAHKDYKQPEEEKKKEIPSNVEDFLTTGNEGHAKFLYDKLLDRKLITKKGAGEYENWITHAKSNPEYRMKLHSYLKGKNLVTADFNSWNKSLFGNEAAVMGPDNEVEYLLGGENVADAQELKQSVEIEGVSYDIAKQLNLNKEAQGDNSYVKS